MTKIVFREEARDDILAIENYLKDKSVSGFENIRRDIYKTIIALKAFPESGNRLGKSKRIISTTKYHFKIIYTLDQDTVTVLGVYRYQNR